MLRTLRSKRVDALWCCVWLAGCAGGSANERPSSSAADARLAEQADSAPDASPLVKQGEAKLGQNDAAGAKQLFEQALAQNPSDARAALDLGIASEQLGDVAAAESAYRTALAAKPDMTQAQTNLGALLREKGALPEAISWLEKASAAGSAGAHQNLALTYEDQGKLDAAAKHYAEALKLQPDDVMTRANYGLLLLKQEKPQLAVRELEQARDGAKGNRPALLAIGNGLRRAGANDAALVAMENAVNTGEPATPALLSELALAQRTAGKREQAVATLQKVIAMDAQYATAHYLLGNMLAADKNFAEAKQHYERYLKLAPTGEHAARAKERLAVIAKTK
jgi:Tfp pilus assembly protein PilF